jgi:hypothetical protein
MDKVFFAVVTHGDQWAGTTLMRQDVPGDVPPLKFGEAAQIVSWSGKHDRIIAGEPA